MDGCAIVRIDLVAEHGLAATRFTRRLGQPDAVRFQHGNAPDGPLEDNAFDVVWIELTILDIAAQDIAIPEADRGPGPGGTCAAFDMCGGQERERVFPVR